MQNTIFSHLENENDEKIVFYKFYSICRFYRFHLGKTCIVIQLSNRKSFIITCTAELRNLVKK